MGSPRVSCPARAGLSCRFEPLVKSMVFRVKSRFMRRLLPCSLTHMVGVTMGFANFA